MISSLLSVFRNRWGHHPSSTIIAFSLRASVTSLIHQRSECRLIATTAPRFWDADNRSSQYGVFSSCSTHLSPVEDDDSLEEDSNNDKLLPTSSLGDVINGDGALNNNDEASPPVNVNIPFRRSKNKSKNSLDLQSSFDDRAQAKLKALATAKIHADESKYAYLLLLQSSKTGDHITKKARHEIWKQSEERLSHSYSQAVKYTSRIPNQNATQTAERLLFEWMDRFTYSFDDDDDDEDRSINKKDKKSTESVDAVYVNKKRMVRAINSIIPKISSAYRNASDDNDSNNNHVNNNILPKIRITPPIERDYMNMFRAYSLSKAKRKGQQCETLLTNMLELAKKTAFYYSEEDMSWTEDGVHDIGMELIENGVGTERRWKKWVKESLPKSKAFSIAIKCYAGTTQNESMERILLLNHIHNEFSQCCVPHMIEGVYNDDPYVLFHSIKSLKNFQIDEERELGNKWIHKLHKFVTSYENLGYLVSKTGVTDDDESEEHYDAINSFQTTIDVTSAYTTVIRLLAKLRGTKGVASDARNILDLMHKIHYVYDHGLKAGDGAEGGASASGRIASIDIRANAYNLVLGLYRDSKDEKDSTNAFDLLQQMVDAGNKPFSGRNGVPLPNEQSFEFAILALAHLSDSKKAIQLADQLLTLMEGQEYIEPSIAVHNAYLTLCIKQLHGKSELFDKAQEVLGKLKQMHDLSPNSETLSLVIKACSVSDRDDNDEVLAKATEIFSQLVTQEITENSALALTDGAYFHMMKCVVNHEGNYDAKKERIEQLFSDACQRGMCSANVLSIFRNSVSEEEYRLTVGKGRLADKWITNVTSPLAQKARYTDGTKGGKDKHARRKGKSSSGWAKKEAAIEGKKMVKNAKKFHTKL